MLVREEEAAKEGCVKLNFKLSSGKKSLLSRIFPCYPFKRKAKMVVIDEKPFLSGVIEGKIHKTTEIF